MLQEQVRPVREAHGVGPGGLGDVFADSGAVMVTVAHGPYSEQLPVANMAVGEIRARYRDRFDIDPQSQGVVDGNEVGDDTVVRTGQVLMFVRKAGEKGCRSCCHYRDFWCRLRGA